VQERLVSIKVLTIGTKQVTQALYRQLVEENVIEEEKCELRGDVWGWVNLHVDCEGAGKHLHVVWEKDGQLRRARVDRKCQLHDYVCWLNHFKTLAQLQMYNEFLDEGKKCHSVELVTMYHHRIFVNRPPCLDLKFGYTKEHIRKDIVRLLHEAKCLIRRSLDEYISSERRYYPEGDMSDASDMMSHYEDEWEEKYQEIEGTGQLFIAVSGVWK